MLERMSWRALRDTFQEKEGEKVEGEKEGVITDGDYEIDSEGSQGVEVNRIFESGT